MMRCPKCGSEMKKAMDKVFRLWWVCDCDGAILIDSADGVIGPIEPRGHEEKVGGEKR